VVSVADANPGHLGHYHRADGRWRIYVFADSGALGGNSPLQTWANQIRSSPMSPIVAFTPAGADLDSVFDVKVIYQSSHEGVDISQVPDLFMPRVGPLGLIDYEKVFATATQEDIFDSRQVDRNGCVVVVRPDQYVAHVLSLQAVEELSDFFAEFMLTP
jgi:phenol 2-monooxygenase